jgi:DnaJ homolog subfamily C member 19
MVKLILAVLALAALYLLLRAAMKPKVAPLALDEREARAVLGVGADADADAIRAAHRRLAAGVHPDRGGSAELARRVNAARDVLLKRQD